MSQIEQQSITPGVNPPKKGFHLGGFLFRVLVSTGVLVVSILLTLSASKTNAPEQTVNHTSAAPLVNVESVALQKDGLTFSVDGTVVPYREVPLASEVAGRVVFLAPNCRVGRYVTAGETLIKIDPEDYLLAQQEAVQTSIQAQRVVEELNVTIENYKSQKAIAEKQLALQNSEVRRVRGLVEEGAISQTDLESAELAELTKRDAVQTLENQIRTAGSQRERLVAAMNLAKVAEEKAQLNLDRCTIKAPFDGVVVALDIEQDKFVQRGESLFTIHDTSKLEVRCSLYMKHVEWLWSTLGHSAARENVRNYYQFPRTNVEIRYTLEGVDYIWSGVLQYLDGPGLDSRTRMFPCRVVVDDPLKVEVCDTCGTPQATPSLLPGMFVKVRVHVAPDREVLSLPESAVLPGGTVWKVISDKNSADVLKSARIGIAQRDGDRVMVYAQAGVLEAGERVVTSPLAAPADGVKVEVAP